MKYEKNERKQCLLYEMLTEITTVQLIIMLWRTNPQSYRTCFNHIVNMRYQSWQYYYGTLWTLTFFFFFYLFFLILYFFSFLFLFINDEEAHDIAVTWCDVIGLEHGWRICKMMSEHMVYIWWLWVRCEANMR